MFEMSMLRWPAKFFHSIASCYCRLFLHLRNKIASIALSAHHIDGSFSVIRYKKEWIVYNCRANCSIIMEYHYQVIIIIISNCHRENRKKRFIVQKNGFLIPILSNQNVIKKNYKKKSLKKKTIKIVHSQKTTFFLFNKIFSSLSSNFCELIARLFFGYLARVAAITP